MDTPETVARWLGGFAALQHRSRQAAAQQPVNIAREVKLSIELMEVACQVERSPAARRRREKQSAEVRALWLRAAQAVGKQKVQRPSKRSQT